MGPLIFVGTRTVNINQDALQTSILELHTALANSFSEKVFDYLQVVHNEIPYITQILSTQDLAWPQVEAMLTQTLDQHENFVSLSLLDNKTGKEKYKVFNPDLEKNPKLVGFGDNPYFKKILEEQLNRVISPIHGHNGLPCLDLFYRNKKENFVIHIKLSLKPLWDKLEEIRLGKTGYAFLVDETGRIIAHRNPDLVFKKADNLVIVQQALKALSQGSSEYTDENGVEMVGAYDAVEGLNWAVIVQQPKKEAYLSSMLMRRQAVYLVIISILLASIVAFFVARSLTRPIITLVRAAGQIARRDFSVKVEEHTYDEMDDLIGVFNNMSAELKKYDDMQIDRLLAEKTKTEAVLFSVGEGIIMTDHKGEILLINSMARKMFKIEHGSLEGKFLWDYLPGEEIREALEEVIKDPEAIKELDLSSEELMKVYQASSNPVVTQKGEKLGIVTVMRDITLEKQLEKMKDDFLHSITHDLRNPMTSIRGFLKFMAEGIGGPLTDQQKKMVDTMDRASIRLLGMINDILDLSKLESGRMELVLDETDFNDIAKRVTDLLEPQIAKKKINMELNIPEPLPKIRADSKLMERVINNLVGNALKFTPEQGTITITMLNKDKEIEISVRDTGEGIPKDFLDKIFDKFGQVTGHKKGGTGLGLTICKYIAENHKGRIWVESDLGEGAKFAFTIPKNLTKEMVTNN